MTGPVLTLVVKQFLLVYYLKKFKKFTLRYEQTAHTDCFQKNFNKYKIDCYYFLLISKLKLRIWFRF